MAERKYKISTEAVASLSPAHAAGGTIPRISQKMVADLLDLSPMSISNRFRDGWTAGQLIELGEVVGVSALETLIHFGVVEKPKNHTGVVELKISGTAEEIRRVLHGAGDVDL